MDHHKKSIALFVFFVSLFCTAANAETRIFGKPYAFSIAPQIGFIYGTSYEIVYRNNSSDDEYLSELQWELKPLFVLGIGFSLEPLNTSGFFADFLIQAGLPGETGTMEDRDWMIPGTLTHFSSHTNKTKAAILLSLEGGYSFPITKMFFIRPLLSLEYFYFNMEGSNGYYSYSSGWWTGTFSGPVITYTQHWILFSPGLCFGFMPGRFTIKGSIQITPLILCFDIDDHILRKTRWIDTMIGLIAIKPALDISFAFSPKIAAGIVGSWHYITGTRGSTKEEEYGVSNSSTQLNNFNAGAGLSLFESSLYIRITLGRL